MKQFSVQGFLHDLYDFDWGRISLIDDVEIARTFFYDGFTGLVNKHAPLKRHRVKGQNNVWFSNELSDLLLERNQA